MEHNFTMVENTILAQNTNELKNITLFSGINLYFYSSVSKLVHIQHPKWENVLEINYCSKGRISWDMGNNKQVFLGPGDFSIHTMDACSDSSIALPTGYYEGIGIWIDFSKINPAELPFLTAVEFSLDAYVEKFCKQGTFSSFAGSPLTTAIFVGFDQNNDAVGLALQKVKCLELLLYLLKMPLEESRRLTEYQSELVEIIHKIHDKLMQNMKMRYTIEELAKQYAINPTTLKAVFKSVYGNSLAAHVKEHRMERAAQLLRETNKNIAQVGQAVGYESQSKFTTAFKDKYHMLPTEYRRVKQKK